MSNNQRYWFEVEGFEGHRGDKVYDGLYIYYHVKTIIDALGKYNTPPGGKKSSGRSRFTPCVRKLTGAEALKLEEIIKNDGKIPFSI